MEQLIKIQSELKAPKGQYNSFGKYKYRSCEDILEALKPLLLKYNCLLTITDDVIDINGMSVIRSTVTIEFEDKSRSVSGYAGIDPDKKGMDLSQCFGASSSYARKYALNGLFLIDDNKDADSTNKHEEKKPEIDPTIMEVLKSINDKDELTRYYNELVSGKLMTKELKALFTKKAENL